MTTMQASLPLINDSPNLHTRDGFYEFVYGKVIEYAESGGTVKEYMEYVSTLLPDTQSVFAKAIYYYIMYGGMAK